MSIEWALIIVINIAGVAISAYMIGYMHASKRPKSRVMYYHNSPGDDTYEAVRKMVVLAKKHKALVLARTNAGDGGERLKLMAQ